MEAFEVGTKIKYRTLFLYRDYMIILIANFISRFGDSVDSIAYGWMVYQLTGSKLLLGTLFAVNSLPNIFFGPFAGVIADRCNKKLMILFVYIGRGLMVSLTAFMYLTGALQPWHLFIFTIINSTLETLSAPVFLNIIPKILPKELYLTGNSFSTSAYKFAELIGLGITGVIIALIGISGAIFVDGLTFFLAALFITLIKVKYEKNINAKMSINTYLSELKEGFLFIRKNYLIRTLLIVFAIANFCLAPLNVLLPAYVSENLKSDANMLSILGVALSIGIILGGLMIGAFANKVKKHWLMCMGVLLVGITYSIFYFPGNVIPVGIFSNAVATLLYFLFGISIPMITTPVSTNIMLNTDQSLLGRVGSFIGVISCSAIPLGSAIAGSISEFFSMTSIFLVMGIMIAVVGIILFSNKRLKELAG